MLGPEVIGLTPVALQEIEKTGKQYLPEATGSPLRPMSHTKVQMVAVVAGPGTSCCSC